jgi:hypothetical protein
MAVVESVTRLPSKEFEHQLFGTMVRVLREDVGFGLDLFHPGIDAVRYSIPFPLSPLLHPLPPSPPPCPECSYHYLAVMPSEFAS